MNVIKQISIAVLFVLLLTISAQAAEISVEINIEKYSDDISTAVKGEIDYNEVLSKALSEDKSENEKVKDDKVKFILNSTKEAMEKSSYIKLDKAQEDNIIDSLNNIIPELIDEYEHKKKDGYDDAAINKLRESVAVAIRASIINSFASRAEMKFKKEIENINEKLDRLETAKKPKMIRPNKEVDFLFEAVVGNKYTMSDDDKNMERISEISIGNIWTTVTFKNNNPKRFFFWETIPPELIETKMKVVEKTLKLEGEGDLINRINRVQNKLNNKDWQTDHLRFGVLTGQLNVTDAIATSVVLHSYFGYGRFMPGALDFGRRLSLFFAVGAASSTDGKGDFSGPVYSIGLGVDIVKGVVLSGGWSVFSHRDDKSQDYKGKESLIVGISLNTELWRALFNE